VTAVLGWQEKRQKYKSNDFRYTFTIFTIKTDHTGCFALNLFSVCGPSEQIKVKSKGAPLSSLQEPGPQIPISWALQTQRANNSWIPAAADCNWEQTQTSFHSPR